MEVIHNGTNTNMEFVGIAELPGALRVPFMESPSVRRDTRGDFVFPSWGFGPRRLFWPKLVKDLKQCGTATMAARRFLSC